MDKQEIQKRITAAEKELAEAKALLEKETLKVGQKFIHSRGNKWVLSKDTNGNYGLICYDSPSYQGNVGLAYTKFTESIDDVFGGFAEKFTKIKEKKDQYETRSGRYKWEVTISDGDGPFTYVFPNGRGDLSVKDVSECVGKLLNSEIVRKK